MKWKHFQSGFRFFLRNDCVQIYKNSSRYYFGIKIFYCASRAFDTRVWFVAYSLLYNNCCHVEFYRQTWRLYVNQHLQNGDDFVQTRCVLRIKSTVTCSDSFIWNDVPILFKIGKHKYSGQDVPKFKIVLVGMCELIVGLFLDVK